MSCAPKHGAAYKAEQWILKGVGFNIGHNEGRWSALLNPLKPWPPLRLNSMNELQHEGFSSINVCASTCLIATWGCCFFHVQSVWLLNHKKNEIKLKTVCQNQSLWLFSNLSWKKIKIKDGPFFPPKLRKWCCSFFICCCPWDYCPPKPPPRSLCG